jgi:hypothetical protein
MPWLAPRVRRSLKVAVAMVTFLTLAGATYQGVATAIERRGIANGRPGSARAGDVGGMGMGAAGAGEDHACLQLRPGGTRLE